MEDERIFVEVSAAPLNIEKFVKRVKDDGAGAISTFSGITRNTFEGRPVLKLEYEAYVPMATEEIKKICKAVFEKWPIIKMAVGHRIGVVCVGETSVIITISSSHRTASLEAVQWTIDELKATVPIWKKEFFADGFMWKENEESRKKLKLLK